jgi:hypothetical protein
MVPFPSQERYFKLVGNLLFCLRLAPQGKVVTLLVLTLHPGLQGEVTEPVLVLLMENFTVSADPAQVPLVSSSPTSVL